MARSSEPIIWSLFAAGGGVAAMLVPIHIVILGLAIPLGILEAPDHGKLLTLVQHPITRLYLFVLISLPLYHWAHRFRFTLVDLGLKSLDGLIALVCYTSAVAGTVATAMVLWRLHP